MAVVSAGYTRVASPGARPFTGGAGSETAVDELRATMAAGQPAGLTLE
jgi:hypothetical protein